MTKTPEGERTVPKPEGLPPKPEAWPTAAELRKAAQQERPVQEVLNEHRSRIYRPRLGRRHFGPRRP